MSRTRTAIVGMLSTAALLFSVLPSRSTFIIAVVTETDIVLGADSRVVTVEMTHPKEMCKIVSGPNNIFVAFSGFMRATKRNFVMADVVRHAISNGTTIETRIAALNDVLVPKVTQIVNDLRINDRPYFHDHVDGKVVTEIVFVGFENSVSHLDVMDYRVRAKQIPIAIEITRKDCPQTGCVGNNGAMLGHHEGVAGLLAADPNIWIKPGLANTVRTVIEAEAAAEPQIVGGPIAVLEITKDGGPNWISNGACAATAKLKGQ